MAKRAYAYGRDMTWPTVGAEYLDVFADVASGAAPRDRRRPRVGEPVHA